MTSTRKQQRLEDLQVPVPTFPLSSPISEEIDSPTCSSAEDRDLERTRPFDFLVKATRQKVESRQAQIQSSSQGREAGSRLSIRGITKKKKNNVKPVGLNLVTDFTLSAPPKKQKQQQQDEGQSQVRDENVPAPFVDLNDLKLLSKARGKERTAQKKQNPFLSKNPFLRETPRSQPQQQQQQQQQQLQQLQDQNITSTSNDSPQENINPFLDPNLQDPFSDRNDSGLSPSDRNVMIGLTVPYPESSSRPKEIDGHGDQHTPLTPSIIVTPAREDAPWSTSSPELLRPRATSSVYSQPTPRGWEHDSNVPPVPAIPEAHKKEKGLGSGFLNAHFNAMTRKRRSMSADTIFEDADVDSPDDSQPRRISHASIDDNNQVPLASRLSVDTEATRPQSQGWWTYLLSPLLGKKSPLSPSFPRDTLVSPSTKSTKEWWDEKEVKETSYFSPDTPQTMMINWDEGTKNTEQSRSLDNDDDEATTMSKRRTLLSTVFPDRLVQGEAFEYYMATFHEEKSQTPYFKCENHICSITPQAAILAAEDDCPGETRDRALIWDEAYGDEFKEKDRGIATSEAGTKGLLIDVDSPTDDSKLDGQKKEIAIASPALSSASSSSADSWDSPLADDNEKGFPEPTKETSRGVAEPSPPQVQPTEPVQPPPQETAAPPAPAPAPAPEPAPPAPIPPQEIPPAQPPQIIHNHYGAPQEPAPVQQPVPHYVPVFPPQPGPAQVEPHPQISDWPKSSQTPQAPAISTDRGLNLDDPVEDQLRNTNEPISPGFQRAAAGPGAIQLSEVNPARHSETNNHDVNAPAPAYTQYPREGDREVALPPRYDHHPAPGAAIMDPTGPAGPMEYRRRRLEREDAAGRKVGGFWRGRGCISNKGCFGRPGREGRLRRRWYLGICTLFLIIVIVAIVLATTLTKKGNDTPVESNWLNLTGYPPMPTGISTIAGTELQDSSSTCITPSTLWSCALPKDSQSDNKPYKGNEPTFRIQILFRNGTYDNSTTLSSKTKTRRGDIDWTPSPSTPSLPEQSFLGNTTDGNSAPYAGEETPFYISLLSPVHLSSTNIYRRSNTSSSSSSNSTGTGTLASNLTDIFPPPDESSNGKPSSATLYPLPSSQPIRLYNRNKDTEHYGFYTYYDKSIFLSSSTPLDGGSIDKNPDDQDGGSTAENARVRCTWSQTRFLVQIWTRGDKLGRNLLSSTSSGSGSKTSATATSTSTSTSTPSSSATDYTRPGSFPYAVTITLDRHGGSERDKLVYCYGIEDGRYNITEKMLQSEERGSGGKLVNSVQERHGDDDDLPGIDGGSGGCGCEWVNWISTS